jgi:crotonobetainyl-CoA:carnitine CoA-transferase CaiB-like acyl-CoA transferase
MGSVTRLAELLECPALLAYSTLACLFEQRDEIKNILAVHLRAHTTGYWLAILEPADVWCADVLTMQSLMEHEGFKALDMVQEVTRPGCEPMQTLRCPLRVDGQLLKSNKGAPRLGADTETIRREFLLPTSDGDVSV